MTPLRICAFGRGVGDFVKSMMFWMLLSGCLSVEAFEGMTNDSFPHQPNFF